MSKAFDKVQNEMFIFKIISIKISSSLLKVIDSFLEKIFPRVLLKCQASDLLRLKAGAPQEFNLGLLVFLIYIKDLSTHNIYS